MIKKCIFGLMAVAALMITSCSSCEKSENKSEITESEITKLNASSVTSTDREYMYINYGSDYRWFEQCVLLKDFLDEDGDGTIEGISNVFQVIDKNSDSYDTYVLLIAHSDNGKDSIDVKHGFWVEDFPLNDADIEITFEQAYDKIMQVNFPKPHSRHCVLRKEIGPIAANPQYIFGNNKAQLYVDAVTGEVSDKNPAFGGNFGMPLGEWP